MMWSFSAHASFRRCPRQWFYRKIYANSRARDPLRREACRLSMLESIQAWRGKIVDTVISDTVVPSIQRKRTCGLDAAISKADELFAQSSDPEVEGAFFEAEYGLPLTDATFESAYADIHVALENLYKADVVWSVLNRAATLLPQRTLSFRHGDASVQVRPDLITFHASRPPVIFDWKVNTRPLRDYWLQLVTGAIALTRCNAHRDWPNGAVGRHSPHDIQLLEVQLLTGDVRIHRASAADIEEAEDFISASLSEMQFACGDGQSDLGPQDFPVTNNPFTCQTCPFRKLCWGPVP
jgi:hypothetical protein